MLAAALVPAMVLTSCKDESPKAVINSVFEITLEMAKICDDFDKDKISEEKAIKKLKALEEEAKSLGLLLTALKDKAKTDEAVKAEIEAAMEESMKTLESQSKDLDMSVKNAIQKSPAIMQASNQVLISMGMTK